MVSYLHGKPTPDWQQPHHHEIILSPQGLVMLVDSTCTQCSIHCTTALDKTTARRTTPSSAFDFTWFTKSGTCCVGTGCEKSNIQREVVRIKLYGMSNVKQCTWPRNSPLRNHNGFQNRQANNTSSQSLLTRHELGWGCPGCSRNRNQRCSCLSIGRCEAHSSLPRLWSLFLAERAQHLYPSIFPMWYVQQKLWREFFGQHNRCKLQRIIVPQT